MRFTILLAVVALAACKTDEPPKNPDMTQVDALNEQILNFDLIHCPAVKELYEWESEREPARTVSEFVMSEEYFEAAGACWGDS